MFEGQEDYSKKKKSFWAKPEGVGAIIMIAIGAIAFAFSAQTIIAFIGSVLASVAGIIIVGFIAALIIFAWNDKRLRTSIRYVMKSWLKGLASAVGVKTNPIAILEGYVDDLRNKRLKMISGRQKMMHQIANMTGKRNKRRDEFNEYKNLALTARSKGDETLARRNASKAEQVDALVQKYDQILSRMEFLLNVIKRMEKAADVMIDEIKFKVEMKKEEYEAMRTSHGVISDAWAIIKGGTSEKMLFDEAWDYVTEQTEYRVLDMENMLHGMQDFMDTIDLKNEASLEAGLAKLDQWEASLNSNFEGGLDFMKATDNPKAFAESRSMNSANGTSKKKEKVKVSADAKKAGSKYFN